MPAASFVDITPDPRGLPGLSRAPNLTEIMGQIEAMCREAKARTSMRRAADRSSQPANLNEE